jgi:hypothetical protein
VAMNKRKSFSLAFLLAAVLGPFSACGGGVDPVGANAVAGCEAASAAALMTGESMLPGRACLNCHKTGGQASGEVFTVAGTVFAGFGDACDKGGIAGATVEILNASGSVQLTLTTNSVGNFHSTSPVTFPLRARVKAAGKTTQEMSTPQQSGNCASCHAKPGISGAPGRIFIN